jgi:hypothetical protein
MTHHFVRALQFKPDTFVDGLLGIGKAFGGKSANEGKELETRLSAMRKERDSLAKNPPKKVITKAASFPWNTAQAETEAIYQPTSTSDFDDVTPITDFQPGGRGSVGSNKSKKKKKKK